jgi:hypothetical protein
MRACRFRPERPQPANRAPRPCCGLPAWTKWTSATRQPWCVRLPRSRHCPRRCRPRPHRLRRPLRLCQHPLQPQPPMLLRASNQHLRQLLLQLQLRQLLRSPRQHWRLRLLRPRHHSLLPLQHLPRHRHPSLLPLQPLPRHQSPLQHQLLLLLQHPPQRLPRHRSLLLQHQRRSPLLRQPQRLLPRPHRSLLPLLPRLLLLLQHLPRRQRLNPPLLQLRLRLRHRHRLPRLHPRRRRRRSRRSACWV